MTRFCFILAFLFAAVLSTQAASRVRSGNSSVTAGIRQYSDHGDEPELPFSSGDFGYLIAYEYHESIAFWQMGLAFATHNGDTTNSVSADSSITPQLSLIFKDRIFLGGVGLMKTYVSGDENYWTEFYWQVQLGLQLPLNSSLSVQMGVFYMLDEWDDVSHFDTGEVELGLSLSYAF